MSVPVSWVPVLVRLGVSCSNSLQHTSSMWCSGSSSTQGHVMNLFRSCVVINLIAVCWLHPKMDERAAATGSYCPVTAAAVACCVAQLIRRVKDALKPTKGLQNYIWTPIRGSEEVRREMGVARARHGYSCCFTATEPLTLSLIAPITSK
jgi:hypothetical protein